MTAGVALGWQPTSVKAAAYSRGAAAVAGTVSQQRAIADRLGLLNLSWYYDYRSSLDDETPGTTKVGVLRGGEINRTALDAVGVQARRHPGHYWIIFNEPDLVGQDYVSDHFLGSRGQDRFAYYAQVYHDYAVALKSADPTARLVGPNLFNWQGNYRTWIESFLAAYRSRYGTEAPIDVWGLHVYSFDPTWTHLPQIDLEYSKLLVSDFKAYVRSLPGQADAPIWVTETGTNWGYRDLVWDQSSGKPYGMNYAWSDLANYTSEFLPWLEDQGIGRWFLFSTNPYEDTWSETPNASYLLDNQDQLTEFGVAVKKFVTR